MNGLAFPQRHAKPKVPRCFGVSLDFGLYTSNENAMNSGTNRRSRIEDDNKIIILLNDSNLTPDL